MCTIRVYTPKQFFKWTHQHQCESLAERIRILLTLFSRSFSDYERFLVHCTHSRAVPFFTHFHEAKGITSVRQEREAQTHATPSPPRTQLLFSFPLSPSLSRTVSRNFSPAFTDFHSNKAIFLFFRAKATEHRENVKKRLLQFERFDPMQIRFVNEWKQIEIVGRYDFFSSHFLFPVKISYFHIII